MFWPFIMCYFANMATTRIADIGTTAYDSNWFDCSPELRKYIVLIIARSQESINFTGLGLIYCNMEVFGKVSEKSGSFEISLTILPSSITFIALQNILFMLLDFQTAITTLKCID